MCDTWASDKTSSKDVCLSDSHCAMQSVVAGLDPLGYNSAPWIDQDVPNVLSEVREPLFVRDNHCRRSISLSIYIYSFPSVCFQELFLDQEDR